MSEKILELKDVCVSFKGAGRQIKEVLKGVSFELNRGEILGLAGESGSGKTTIAKSILGMVKPVSGECIVNTANPQMVFQDPYGSLNPAMSVGWIMQEPLKMKGGMNAEERKAAVLSMLEEVGLGPEYYDRKSTELSGGQRQRVCIGAALMRSPKLLIADEPVSALDVTVAAQVLKLMKDLKEKHDLSMLFISHDLRVMYHFCDRVLILKDGRIVEEGVPAELYRNPKEEYTRLLLSSAGIIS